jgi:hypothetical protein
LFWLKGCASQWFWLCWDHVVALVSVSHHAMREMGGAAADQRRPVHHRFRVSSLATSRSRTLLDLEPLPPNPRLIRRPQRKQLRLR